MYEVIDICVIVSIFLNLDNDLLLLAIDKHIKRMSIAEVLLLYLTRSQEYTMMLYNAEFYQLRMVKKMTSANNPGFNGKRNIYYELENSEKRTNERSYSRSFLKLK